MKANDALIASFRRQMPARVAQATGEWLAFEQGADKSLAVLRRVLHTIKGEAHMLEQRGCAELAEIAETLLGGVAPGRAPPPLLGDALLGALEGMAFVTSEDADSDPPDLGGLYELLESALAAVRQAELETATAGGAPPPLVEVDAARKPPPRHGSTRPSRDDTTPVLRPEDLRPLVHEMRRLHGEQEVFHTRLREVQRMLRALLDDIDPRLPAQVLAERITKTLGYGTEVDRQVSWIRTEWRSNEFSLGLALDELEAVVRRASMVATDDLLNQVRRVARSTARTLDKDVEIRVTGDAVLDSTVGKRLEPALLHLVRNAIDHGIESKEMRTAQGKPERGRVDVSIHQSESLVRVEVADDGGGIRFEPLRRAVAARGIDVSAMNEEALMPYLFAQGVSTSKQVSTISGRGVGLDVVAREVALAGGHVRIESTGATGTCFVLEVPTAMRAELALPVLAGRHRYAFPTRAVSSVTRLDRLERTPGGLWLRVSAGTNAQLVRVYALRALVGGTGEPRAGEPVVVLRHAAGLFALTVDGYDNPRPITIQRAEELPFPSPLLRGVAPSADGGVLLLLDVENLYGASQRHPSGALATPLTPGGRQRTRRALVVEDAPVARELLCGILRSLGLVVEEATDGRQGLMMARNCPPDVILTDIEMPYMGGVELITQLRRSTGLLAQVPVIVLSTVADARRPELEQLGVAAVLSKQKFVETELRKWIERCTGSLS